MAYSESGCISLSGPRLNRMSSRDSADLKIAGQYDLEHTIGQGHFAVVKLARHTFTGEKVAVKVIDKSKLDPVSREHLFQEVMCMKLVQHPNVVRLYEVIDTATKLYLILELGDGGDLYDYIVRQDGGLPESQAKSYFHQIITAMAYCHKLHVCHRDLKPENCIFFPKLQLVKLTDFGFSNVFTPGKHLETSCGSLAYSAPEILLGDSYDATKVDVWSLGVILFMLVSGKPPFQETNDSETLAKIMDVKYSMPRHVGSQCRSLIKRLLCKNPLERASLDDILNDDWFSDVIHQTSPIYAQPLVCKEQIPEEDHNDVLEKMVEGELATKEEILSTLARDDYNYITATYYLLVERKMKRHLIERSRISASLPRPVLVQRQTSSELESIPEDRSRSSCASLSVEDKLRRFSMIIEEEDDMDMEELEMVAEENTSDSDCSSSKVRRPSIHRALVSVRSSPQLLKSVRESIEEESIPHSPLGSGWHPSRMMSPTTYLSSSGRARRPKSRKSRSANASSRSSTTSDSDSPSRPLSEFSISDSEAVVSALQTGAIVNVVCDPIREEEIENTSMASANTTQSGNKGFVIELPSSHPNSASQRRRSDDKPSGGKTSQFSLSSSVARESNFSLSSLASSLRSLSSQKVMADLLKDLTSNSSKQSSQICLTHHNNNNNNAVEDAEEPSHCLSLEDISPAFQERAVTPAKPKLKFNCCCQS